MTREEFIQALGEFVDHFVSDRKKVDPDPEIFSIGKHGLEEIILLLRIAFITEELPDSPFTVTGGKIAYSLGKDPNDVLVLKIALHYSYS